MNFLIALALGAASAFAFQPFAFWPLMILAFAGLCEIIGRAPNLKQALLLGWGFSVGQFVVGLNWIATAFTYQAAMPAWLGWVAVILLSFYLAVYPMLGVGLAWRYGRTHRIALILALAGGWAITEWLRGTMFTGFAWNPVGAALVDTPWRQSSATIGTYGLSALVVTAGGILWLAYKRDLRPAAIGSVVLLATVLLPGADLPSASRSTIRPPIRIVQPNIGQEDKWREGLAAEAAAKLERLSVGASPVPRLVLWPEVAVIEPMQVEDLDRRPLPLDLPAASKAVRSINPGDLLVTGGLALIADRNGQIVGNTNSVFALDSSARIGGRYDKAHLVPYGEYLPMRPLLSRIGLSQLAPGIGDTASGPGARTIDLGAPWGRMGLQICYEIIFSGEVLDRANRPDFLFNPSNDAWFGRWGPPQHLAQARLRAAEEGIPVIRSTPTGISAVVDARGKLLASLPWRKAGVIDGQLPLPAAGLTFFARFGNIVPLGLAFLLLFAAIALARGPRYRQT
ncbi:MAG TPA: apolipoprotein N-acyltransferase [Sphingomicrobium sp.]|nr:apolipoprotein N-acyltransferase [Sphingomicrobium sp.]